MPKILVNYTYNKKNNTYSLLDNNVVFADMPVAIMDMGVEYDEILVIPINNQNTVVDKVEYLKINKQFKLIANEDRSVKEDVNGTPIWLPKDTDITKLRVINGQLVLVSEDDKVGE
jgi:hypothetical protein